MDWADRVSQELKRHGIPPTGFGKFKAQRLGETLIGWNQDRNQEKHGARQNQNQTVLDEQIKVGLVVEPAEVS